MWFGERPEGTTSWRVKRSCVDRWMCQEEKGQFTVMRRRVVCGNLRRVISSTVCFGPCSFVSHVSTYIGLLFCCCSSSIGSCGLFVSSTLSSVVHLCTCWGLACVPEGNAQSHIVSQAFVLVLSRAPVRAVWLETLVLDNCTLLRSVVPSAVSLWPELREPFLGSSSSSSCPVSSPSCPAPTHNAAGGRYRDAQSRIFTSQLRIFILDLQTQSPMVWLHKCLFLDFMKPGILETIL